MSEVYGVEIPGTPVAQPRHRVSARGGFVKLYLPKTHPVHEYKLRVAEYTKEWPVFVGPVDVFIEGFFPMPKSWSKKKRAQHVKKKTDAKPDPDNISKAILDALKNRWRDDCQVADLRCVKRWTDGVEGHTWLQIRSSDD